MMKTNNTALSALLAMLLALLVVNLPTAATAAKDDPRGGGGGGGSPAPQPKDEEPYKAVNGFCRQRTSRREREFCIRALKSDPRSASANDIIGLLKISVDIAVVKANKTLEFLRALSMNKATHKPLIAVLKKCSTAYDWCLKELKIIPRELQDDTALASYDALMASDALKSCKESLNKHKIVNYSILYRHRIATAYVRLCVDIARGI